MKNIHLLPTDSESKLVIRAFDSKLCLHTRYTHWHGENQHLYITFDEIVNKDGEWYLWGDKVLQNKKGDTLQSFCKKIILTTDPVLIADGIQAIEDEFLQWYVAKANDSGKPIDIVEVKLSAKPSTYKLIIPEEERNVIDNWLEKHGDPEISKQVEEEAEELYLEEEALRFLPRSEVEHDTDFIIGFGVGAQWQAERMYSESEIRGLLIKFHNEFPDRWDIDKWFNANKKKHGPNEESVHGTT